MYAHQKEILEAGRAFIAACRGIRACDNGEPLVRVDNDAPNCRFRPTPAMLPWLGRHTYLRETVRDKLRAAAAAVRAASQGRYSLLLMEGYRPPLAQTVNFELAKHYYRFLVPGLRGDDDVAAFTNSFVADPRYGGHPCGAAVDVSLWDNERHRPAACGNPSSTMFFDSLRPAAARDAQELKDIVDSCFTAQGFVRTPCEWWHFAYGDFEWAQLTRKEATLFQPAPWRPAMLAGAQKY